jgi:hypothetical protein
MRLSRLEAHGSTKGLTMQAKQVEWDPTNRAASGAVRILDNVERVYSLGRARFVDEYPCHGAGR